MMEAKGRARLRLLQVRQAKAVHVGSRVGDLYGARWSRWAFQQSMDAFSNRIDISSLTLSLAGRALWSILG